MSGAKRIDDHSFWAGSSSKESPLPMQSKMKQESSAEGAGHLAEYQDTTQDIRKAQVMGDSKVKSHKIKSGYRY